jgi:hypothetical protein
MKKLTLIVLILAFTLVTQAQREEEVSGSYTYVLSENDGITLKEAKHMCIELAKAAAIKEKFGELITSDVIDSNVETNGESTNSYYWENTVAMAKGDWLGDTEKPQLDIKYEDDKLIFTAEVKGRAREIIQSKIDLKWEIMKDGLTMRKKTSIFESGERIFVNFRSPADGYVAIYLILGDDVTQCLLPYPKDTDGRFEVKAGREYMFFDKEEDLTAVPWKLSTKRRLENNQLVIIYSPNPFTKCNDKSVDKMHPNTLNTHDLQRWLLKCQREDRDMVVNKKWVKIYQKKQ